MPRFHWLAAAGALLVFPAHAQPPQQFEVASIHPSSTAPSSGTSFNLYKGGRIRIVNEPAKLLIRVAFDLQDPQIIGVPNWLETEPYDIEAKTGRPERVTPEQLCPLMQSLLADRFHLQYHRETRELSVAALVVAKGGPKLKPNPDREKGATNTSGGPTTSHLVATAVPMNLLAGFIGNRLGRLVVDRTGLPGTFDFTIDWSPSESPDSKSPPLITAIQEQLGLKLEPQKAGVGVLVIDHIDRPTGN